MARRIYIRPRPAMPLALETERENKKLKSAWENVYGAVGEGGL